MGNRGPAPRIKTPAKPPTATTAPSWLSKDGADYWTRHREELTANGILTAATEDSFALLCDLWGRVREMNDSLTTRAYLDTVKAFTSLAKQFRLLPTEQPTEPNVLKAQQGKFVFKMEDDGEEEDQ